MITKANLILLSPEIFVAFMASLILVFDLYLKPSLKNITYSLSILTVVVGSVLCFGLFDNTPERIFNGMFVSDPMSMLLKMLILCFMLFIFLYSKIYLKERNLYHGDYFALSLFSVLGMMILVSAGNFLSLYLGLELFALPIYALVVMMQSYRSAPEAAMKYFVMGAVASSLLLYGVSILYGLTGSFEFLLMTQKLSQMTPDLHKPVIFGMVFVLVGLSFKLGAVPFHMWVPDVYEGSPTTVTMFISTVSKIAAFGMAYRLFSEAFMSIQVDWQSMLSLLALLSMTIGNIIAIMQTNLKRMLAYSTISHIGFLLLGFLGSAQLGMGSALFYIISYALMSLGVFGCILALSQKGFESEKISDFEGLSTRYPWIAAGMAILLFSLAGVPPTIGFYAKLMVLQSALEGGYMALVIASVVLSVVGAFYYLRVIKVMYFNDVSKKAKTGASLYGISFTGRVFLTGNIGLVLGLGLFPGGLLALCFRVML